MTTKYRYASSAAEARIVELTSQFSNIRADNMPNTKTVHVPHLGGIDAAYQMPYVYDSSKPTLVLVNSFTTSSELYQSQFKNKQLTDKMNLLAIELLGHGQTRSKVEHFTYWDTAIMNLQVLDALSIKGKIFVLGTSQGGWICVRMALLASEKITGIIPLGTSMDYESQRTRDLGCWDGPAALTPAIDGWTSSSPTPEFKPGEDYGNFLVNSGMGEETSGEARDFWVKEIDNNYAGDDGRKRARMAAINLRDRDGLHGRVTDVTCPVLWMHVSLLSIIAFETFTYCIQLFRRAQPTKCIA
jgi:pimeloyl-ACP methyl ester carboxylesterase